MTKTHKTLPPPFPSAPGGPKAEHELKVFRKGKVVLLELFAATYSAKKFIETLLGKDKPKWINPNVIALEDIDLEIHCKELEDIIEHEYSKDEKAWTLPEPYPQSALRARGQSAPPRKRSVEDSDDLTKKSPREKKDAKNEAPRSALVKRTPPQREVPKGMVTIAQICSELKIEPRVARGILRKNDTPKPDEGWMWDKAGAAKISAMLKKELK